MQTSYTEMLIQWLFFLGLISLLIIPGMLFRKIALRNNKKGWLFFLVGMVIGFIALEIGKLIGSFLDRSPIFAEYHHYIWIVAFLIAGAIDTVAVILFRRNQ